MATEAGKQSEVNDIRAEESIEGSENGTAAPSVSGVEDTSSQTDPEPEKAKQETPAAATAAPAAPPPGMPKPPNGGLTAWLQVFGAFWVYFNTWGLIITFGVFQTYYETAPGLISNYSPSAISWIGTIQAFLLIEIGIIVGPLFDQGYMRYLISSGAVLIVLGLMMASLATEYSSIFLSLGVCTGVGMGLLFFPGISGLAVYFTTRRGMANGIAASGSALGAVIYPIVLRQLIYEVNFAWAVRVVGFIVLATNLVPLVFMKPLLLPKARRKLIDTAIFKDTVYTLFSVTNIIGWLGVQIPLFYAATFAETVVHRRQSEAFYMLAILGAGSLPGRLLAPLAGDRLGPLNLYPAFMALGGVLALAWARVATHGALVAVALLYGFAYGGIVSLPPPAVAAMTRDVRTLGTRIGTAFSFAGVSALVGPPVAGAILQRGRGAGTGTGTGTGGFDGLFGFAGAMMLAGSACLAGVAWLHARQVRRERAVGDG